jgi:hypothetical protein
MSVGKPPIKESSALVCVREHRRARFECAEPHPGGEEAPHSTPLQLEPVLMRAVDARSNRRDPPHLADSASRLTLELIKPV